MRKLTMIAGIGLIALALGIGGLWSFQRRLIYFPSQDLQDMARVLPGAEDVRFPTDDGLTLAGWFMPNHERVSGVTVVVFNGNGGNRADRAPLAAEFHSRGYSVLLFDYRGYGGNPGTPSEEGLLTDGRAAVDYLIARSDVDPERIVYFGESLGAAVAIATAVDRQPAALVLRSPFESLSSVGSVHYPFLPLSILLRDEFPNMEVIATINVPTLVIAGSGDRTVPVEQSRNIHEAAIGPKRLVVIEGADHNDAELARGPRVVDEIALFIETHGS